MCHNPPRFRELVNVILSNSEILLARQPLKDFEVQMNPPSSYSVHKKLPTKFGQMKSPLLFQKPRNSRFYSRDLYYGRVGGLSLKTTSGSRSARSFSAALAEFHSERRRSLLHSNSMRRFSMRQSNITNKEYRAGKISRLLRRKLQESRSNFSVPERSSRRTARSKRAVFLTLSALPHVALARVVLVLCPPYVQPQFSLALVHFLF